MWLFWRKKVSHNFIELFRSLDKFTRIFFWGEHCARCLIDIILLFQQWVPRPVPVAPAPWEASGVQEAEPEQEGDRKSSLRTNIRPGSIFTDCDNISRRLRHTQNFLKILFVNALLKDCMSVWMVLLKTSLYYIIFDVCKSMLWTWKNEKKYL